MNDVGIVKVSALIGDAEARAELSVVTLTLRSLLRPITLVITGLTFKLFVTLFIGFLRTFARRHDAVECNEAMHFPAGLLLGYVASKTVLVPSKLAC